jgi:hypothetical protein
MRLQKIVLPIVILAAIVSAFFAYRFLFPTRIGASVFQVYQGGTGATTFGAGLCLKGNGAGAITASDCGAVADNTYDPWGQATSTLTSHTTTYNHANYNTAYGWGNHAGLYDVIGQATSSINALTTTANSWSGLQQFNGNASTSQLSVSGNSYLATLLGTIDAGGASFEIPNGATATMNNTGQIALDTTSGQVLFNNGLGGANGTTTIPAYFYASFSYSTSTAWTGTTTIPLGPAFIGETWKQVKCFSDTGTLNVNFGDETNKMGTFNASTTIGTITLSTNSAFTAGEKRYVDVGTPATTPTKISCTISKQYDRD